MGGDFVAFRSNVGGVGWVALNLRTGWSSCGFDSFAEAVEWIDGR